MAPFAQVRRRLDGSYIGRPTIRPRWSRSPAQQTDRMPESPSTITSRASAAVGATRAMREQPAFTFSRTHSDPARVFPAPRPAM